MTIYVLTQGCEPDDLHIITASTNRSKLEDLKKIFETSGNPFYRDSTEIREYNSNNFDDYYNMMMSGNKVYFVQMPPLCGVGSYPDITIESVDPNDFKSTFNGNIIKVDPHNDNVEAIIRATNEKEAEQIVYGMLADLKSKKEGMD